jgi:hypothetical protein
MMRLSRDEEVFLRHWMYDEIHYGEGQGSAKRLQVQHQAVPADLALRIAATMPDPADQESAGLGPPPAEPPAWPWPGDTLRVRLADARSALARADGDAGCVSKAGPDDAMRAAGPPACR